MRLEQSQKLAQEIVDQIRPYCESVEVAGSIRRKKSEVHDVDVVLIPKPLLWHRIIAARGARVCFTPNVERLDTVVHLARANSQC